MASIEKKIRSGRTVWMARIRRRGYPPVAEQFARRTDAEVWTQEVERQIRLGQFVFEAEKTATKTTTSHPLGAGHRLAPFAVLGSGERQPRSVWSLIPNSRASSSWLAYRG